MIVKQYNYVINNYRQVPVKKRLLYNKKRNKKLRLIISFKIIQVQFLLKIIAFCI